MEGIKQVKIKKCTKCGGEKPATEEFFHAKRSKDGLRTACKICVKEYYSKFYRNRHPLQKVSREIKICGKCKVEKPATSEFFSKKKSNKDGLRSYCKLCANHYQEVYRNENGVQVSEFKKAWYQQNKERLNERTKEKFKNDENYRIAHLHRTRINSVIRNGQKSAPTIKLLGCSEKEWKQYFISLFTEDMTWESFMRGEIHIDHIRPLASFDLTNPEEQRIAFHYTNTQPLWAADNLSKNDKWEGA